MPGLMSLNFMPMLLVISAGAAAALTGSVTVMSPFALTLNLVPVGAVTSVSLPSGVRTFTMITAAATARPSPSNAVRCAVNADTRRRRGARPWTVTAACSCSICRNASAVSAADCGRRAGSLASNSVTNSASAGGTSGLRLRTGFGVCNSSARSTAITVAPVNGRAPVQSRYSTQPRLNRSLRASTVSAARLLRRHVRRRAHDRPRALSDARPRGRSGPGRNRGF